MKITKVTVSGTNMVEVTAEHEGEERIVRRNVQDYHLYNAKQRKACWNDIIGLPNVEHDETKILGIFKRKK